MLKQIIQKILFGSKWILVIFYFGLIVAQIIYCIKFCQETIHLIANFNEMNESNVMLGVLTLVDITMIGNLIKMIITGSYQTFIEKVHETGAERITSGGRLKVKIGLSLIGVSSIHLLQSFINATSYTDREILIKCGIHMIFVIGTIGLAYVDYLHVKSEQIENKH